MMIGQTTASTPPDANTVIFDADHPRFGYTARNPRRAASARHAAPAGVLRGRSGAGRGRSRTPRAQEIPAGSLLEPTGCEGTLPPRLQAGGTSRVTPGLPNKLRAAPTTASGQIGSIPGEATFTGLSGPTCAEGMYCWQVQYAGVTGWTAESDAEEYYIEPWR